MFHESGKKNSGITEVNVIPVIDVSLVLVVILMLLTPLGFESTIGVNRAAAAARKSAAQQPTERLEIAVLGESEFRVNREVVAREDLEGKLRPLLAGEVPPPVMLSCADPVSHGTFVSVLDVAKQCGAVEIAVIEGAP
jgi:biopolymer transport protein TolR